jgi:hypothetical protein
MMFAPKGAFAGNLGRALRLAERCRHQHQRRQVRTNLALMGSVLRGHVEVVSISRQGSGADTSIARKEGCFPHRHRQGFQGRAEIMRMLAE